MSELSDKLEALAGVLSMRVTTPGESEAAVDLLLSAATALAASEAREATLRAGLARSVCAKTVAARAALAEEGPSELCDFIPTPEMRGETSAVECPKCGHEFEDDGPITYSGCLLCAPNAARAAGARLSGEGPKP